MCPVFQRLPAASDFRPAILQSKDRRAGRRRPHGFLFAPCERGESRFVVSHPSLDHPTDEDLSAGTPVKRWMGHGAFAARPAQGLDRLRKRVWVSDEIGERHPLRG